jgi:transposase-like protein
MLQPHEAKAMTPQERVEALFDYQKQLYGTPGYGSVSALAEVLEIHPQTIYKWRQVPASMPLSALLAVSALATSKEVRQTQLAQAMCDEIERAAEALAVTAARLEALARLAKTVARENLPLSGSQPEPEA